MRQIYTDIEKSYRDRSDNTSLQKQLWQDVITLFPAILDPQNNDRFSYQCAARAGDTGPALLWIVQAALVQGILRDALEKLDIQSGPAQRLRALPRHAIGALAHNDDRSSPVILTDGSLPAVTGKKNYITGGTTSDFILLTARTSPEEKTSSLILLNTRDLPHGSLEELHMGALTTVSHARLTLDRVTVPKENIIPLDPSDLRRSIRRWSILERSLILEAVLGLIEYIYRELYALQIQPDFTDKEITSLVEEQQRLIGRQAAAARKKEKIEEGLIDAIKLQHVIVSLEMITSEHQAALSTDLGPRAKDLFFFKRLMMRE